jgi:hypothetical protein
VTGRSSSSSAYQKYMFRFLEDVTKAESTGYRLDCLEMSSFRTTIRPVLALLARSSLSQQKHTNYIHKMLQHCTKLLVGLIMLAFLMPTFVIRILGDGC